jgi:hypothetical protein
VPHGKWVIGVEVEVKRAETQLEVFIIQPKKEVVKEVCSSYRYTEKHKPN